MTQQKEFYRLDLWRRWSW